MSFYVGPPFMGGVVGGNLQSLCADATGNDGDISGTHVVSLEQVITPTSIKKGHPEGASTPGFQHPGGAGDEPGGFGDDNFVGPTVHELDPYFPTIWGDEGHGHMRKIDFRVFNHDHTGFGGPGTGATTDFNHDKCQPDANGVPQGRESVDNVRIFGLRGPLILSGWGTGMDDFPVPKLGEHMPNKARWNKDLRFDRGTWKTGPVHLMWDDERQVWAGGHRIVCGVLIKNEEEYGADQGIKKATSVCEPSTFKVRLLRNTGADANGYPFIGGADNPDAGDLSDVFDEVITVNNRDISLEQPFHENTVFVIAIKLNYEWLPLWVGCPNYGACGCNDADADDGVEPSPPPCLCHYECPTADCDDGGTGVGPGPGQPGEGGLTLPKKKLEPEDPREFSYGPVPVPPINQGTSQPT